MPVYFERSSIDLKESSEDSLLAYIRQHSGRFKKVVINGYSDAEPGVLFNLNLSTRRALHIYQIIEKNAHVNPENLEYHGLGKGSPPKDFAEIFFYSEFSKDFPDSLMARVRLFKDTLLAGKSIRLKLFFYPGEAELLPVSLPELQVLKEFLMQNPELKIQIEGHVCCNNNMQLSIDRAAEVFGYLVKNGIDEKRLNYKGFGFTRPLVEENSEEDKSLNRRVEIRLAK